MPIMQCQILTIPSAHYQDIVIFSCTRRDTDARGYSVHVYSWLWSQRKQKKRNKWHTCVPDMGPHKQLQKKKPKPNKPQKSSMSSSVKSVSGSAGLMTWAWQVEALRAMQKQYKCHRYIEIHQYRQLSFLQSAVVSAVVAHQT